MINEYDFSKFMMDKMGRGKNISTPLELSPITEAVKVLAEAEDKEKKKPIAITNDAIFGTNVLSSQIDAFRSAVHPGAKFSEANEENPENNPLVYYPEGGNVVFSGSIPSLSNLKFQISVNDVTGAPYIFVDGLSLTPDVLDVLKKLSGFAKNFIDQWASVGDQLAKIAERD